jgi:hypothetical protein
MSSYSSSFRLSFFSPIAYEKQQNLAAVVITACGFSLAKHIFTQN